MGLGFIGIYKWSAAFGEFMNTSSKKIDHKKDEQRAKGAEAIVVFEGDVVIKQRLEKPYREKSFDDAIRKKRTKKEAKLMQKAYDKGLPVPKVERVEAYIIVMERIKGKPITVSEESAKKAGALLKALHNIDIIHNDLTPANILDRKGKFYIIDFGLSFSSKRIEDKASDLFTTATSFKPFSEAVLESYGDVEIIKRYKEIKKRMRYVKD